QAAVGSLLIPAVGRLGARAFDRRGGGLARGGPAPPPPPPAVSAPPPGGGGRRGGLGWGGRAGLGAARGAPASGRPRLAPAARARRLCRRAARPRDLDPRDDPLLRAGRGAVARLGTLAQRRRFARRALPRPLSPHYRAVDHPQLDRVPRVRAGRDGGLAQPLS